MVYKLVVDKSKFKRKVKEHYSPLIIDKVTFMKCYEMLMIELEVKSLKTIYNFQNNKYSIQLLMKIIEILKVEDLSEIFIEIE